MADFNLGRVQGGSFFYSTASAGTSINSSTLTPNNLEPLIGDCVVFSNGDVYKITNKNGTTLTCSKVTNIKGPQGKGGDPGSRGYGVGKISLKSGSTTSGSTATYKVLQETTNTEIGTFDVYNGKDGKNGGPGPQGPQGPAGPKGDTGAGGPSLLWSGEYKNTSFDLNIPNLGQYKGIFVISQLLYSSTTFDTSAFHLMPSNSNTSTVFAEYPLFKGDNQHSIRLYNLTIDKTKNLINFTWYSSFIPDPTWYSHYIFAIWGINNEN